MEKQMCECCKKEEVMEGYPVCLKCFSFIMQWGTREQKQRMKYYLQKERMAKDPEYKAQVIAARRESMRKYQEKNKEKLKQYRVEHKEQMAEANRRYKETHREQWNNYQREYRRKKAAENRALKQRVAELEQQLNSMTRVDNAQLVR